MSAVDYVEITTDPWIVVEITPADNAIEVVSETVVVEVAQAVVQATGAGDLTYVHVQNGAATTWNVVHNLGKYPSCTVVDSANTEIETAVHNIDVNSLTVSLSYAVSGKVYCNQERTMARLFLTPIDLGKLELLNPRLQQLGSNPGSPVDGQFYENTSTHTLRYYNGTAWIDLGRLDQISAPTADVSINSHKLTSVTDPSSAQDAATKNYIDTRHIGDLTAPNGDFSMNTQKITNLVDPTGAQDAATKNYVDGLVVSGVSWKAAVRAATTANGTLATAFINAAVIDGVTLATGDRILVKNQTTGSENGIYTVNVVGAPTRGTDADAAAEVLGMAVFVEEGTANADTAWVCTTDAPITVDTTALTFAKFSDTGAAITGGAGLTRTGNSIDVGAGSGISVAADSVAIDTSVVVTKYATNVGDNSSTSITVTHNLGTKDVIVQVFDLTTPFAQLECDVQHTSTSAITLIFTTAPTSGQYRCVVHA